MSSIQLPLKSTMLNYGTKPISDQQKIADMKLAAYIASHSAIRTIDHLSDVLKLLGKGSILENLRLHRTKCSSIIRHVIAPAMLEQLVEAIGDKGYSIIVDESTDVSTTKFMCLCVRYFNTKDCCIRTDFLGMFVVEEATAKCLHKSVTSFLESIKLPKKNMIAIGTDGANNLCGNKESLYALLKKDIPNLQLLKCTCHSIHLCSSKASEELPSSLEFLLREVYNWFKCSPLRRAKYKRLFDAMNTGIDSNPFHQLIQLSLTRWLAFYDACTRLLEHWLELKTHFSLVIQTEKCYTARMIHDMLCDDTNRLYLIFLKHILVKMQSLNLTFQSEKVDVGSAYDEMYLTFLSFATKILKPVFVVAHKENVTLLNQVRDALNNDLAFLPLESVNFGIDLTSELSTSNVSSEKILVLKERCFNFLKRLLIEMSKRLPTNMEIFKKYKLFSPSKCLGIDQEKFITIIDILRPFLDSSVDAAVYELQWQQLQFVDWKTHCSNNVPVNIVDFWPMVYAFVDSSGRCVFRELAEVVIRMLCIPTSNACVERIFSIMNLVKTKARNKMQMDMLESLIRIRVHFSACNTCCNKFEPTSRMLSLFTASNMYKKAEGDSDEDDTREVFEIMDSFL